VERKSGTSPNDLDPPRKDNLIGSAKVNRSQERNLEVEKAAGIYPAASALNVVRWAAR
jgi:hypothetical protein